MTLTKNRQALNDYLVNFLRKEWEKAPYTTGIVFDTSLVYEFRFLRDGSEVSSFHIWVSTLLILLDIAEMWSRSYRTFGFKDFKKNFGKAAYFFV